MPVKTFTFAQVCQRVMGLFGSPDSGDTFIPLATDATGKLLTATTTILSDQVEITNDTGNPIPTRTGVLADDWARAFSGNDTTTGAAFPAIAQTSTAPV